MEEALDKSRTVMVTKGRLVEYGVVSCGMEKGRPSRVINQGYMSLLSATRWISQRCQPCGIVPVCCNNCILLAQDDSISRRVYTCPRGGA